MWGTPSAQPQHDVCGTQVQEHKEVPVAIVGGFDVHRKQITFDYLDTVSGEVHCGKITPACRGQLRGWLRELEIRPAGFAVEGCTGWRFVVEELRAAGVDAHLAEPADTAALRGTKRRAKTDRLDSRHLRELLAAGNLPESWVPPAHVLEARSRVRLYKTLVDERTAWCQRIHAQLFHHGAPAQPGLLTREGRLRLDQADLSPAGRDVVAVALRIIDALGDELELLRAEIAALARRQPGCRALRTHYGVGSVTSVAIWAELGDCQRFSSSDDAVRHTGLDVTVHSSDGKRTRGRLARQGPPALRWALFEAAKCAARRTSPDHQYYLEVRERLGANRATLSVARKLARRCHHTLRVLGDDAFAPVG
jgi:transposase